MKAHLPKTYNFTLYRGDTYEYHQIGIKNNETGEMLNWNEYLILVHIRDKTGRKILELTVGNGLEIREDGSKLLFFLSPTQTEKLVGTCRYDVELSQNGKKRTRVKGKITVWGDQTYGD